MGKFKRNSDNGGQPKCKNGNGKRKRGAPTYYDPEVHPDMAHMLCKDFGHRLEDLSVYMGVPYGTLEQWWRDHPEFSSAIKTGKDIHDTQRVESKLLQRALGYDYEELKTETVTLQNQHVDGYHSMRKVYDEYTSSDEWKRVVEIIYARDKNKCQKCRKAGVVVHHKNYDNWGKGDDSEAEDCELLCTRCHNKEHKSGEVHVPFWARRNRTRQRGNNNVVVEIPAVKTTRTTKHVLPNITAAFFWLVNRSAGRWQHIQNVKIDIEGKLQSSSRVHVMDWSAIGNMMGLEKLEQLREIFQSLPEGTAIPMDSAGSGSVSGGK
jgi:hypothetical protein